MNITKQEFTKTYEGTNCNKEFFENLYDNLVENGILFTQMDKTLHTKWHDISFYETYFIVWESVGALRINRKMFNWTKYENIDSNTLPPIITKLKNDCATKSVDKESFIKILSETFYSEEVLEDFHSLLIDKQIDFGLDGLTLCANNSIIKFVKDSYKVIFHPSNLVNIYTDENGNIATGGRTHFCDNNSGLSLLVNHIIRNELNDIGYWKGLFKLIKQPKIEELEKEVELLKLKNITLENKYLDLRKQLKTIEVEALLAKGICPSMITNIYDID